jgi:dGTPase
MLEPPGTVADAFEARVRANEEAWLSPLAVRSYEADGGRAHEEEPCRLRTPFQRDRDRIVHSKAFRRLRHKTQVFVDPDGDHFRTRMTHTLEATGISRGVARALRLNEDLTEAIGLGHDLGHPPFGHAGEAALDEVLRERFGRNFRHNEHSLRVVEHLERDGRGLNLTAEVRDGILHHTGAGEPATLEGKIVRLVDRVAYINHDIDDAIRAGLLSADELPPEEIAVLGDTGSRRIDRLVHDLVETSEDAGDIRQSAEIGEAMLALRSFMFERVYLGASNTVQNDRAKEIVQRIFAAILAEPERLPAGDGELPDRTTDFVAGMTDRYALAYVAALETS